MKTIAIINGPNLNLLGTREPELYGTATLADIERDCRAVAAVKNLAVEFYQSNVEGELVNFIQTARDQAAGIIINPGAYSHTSIAIMDALQACTMPIIEVHLSNLAKRDDFRHNSFVSRAATGCVMGLGAPGYVLALEALAKLV